MSVLPDELLSLLRGGAVAIVGTRDGAMTPELSRAWGFDVRVGRDEIELCAYARSGRRTLANIADNGKILYKLLQLYLEQHRQEFTNKEIRLDPSLKLPEFEANLEAA